MIYMLDVLCFCMCIDIYVVYINIFTYIARKVQAKQLPCGLIPLELPQGIAKDLGFGSTANSSVFVLQA